MSPDEKFASYVRAEELRVYPEPELHDDVEGMTFGVRLVLVALGLFLAGATVVGTSVVLALGALL